MILFPSEQADSDRWGLIELVEAAEAVIDYILKFYVFYFITNRDLSLCYVVFLLNFLEYRISFIIDLEIWDFSFDMACILNEYNIFLVLTFLS